MEDKKPDLMTEINPVFLTAKSCLGVLARLKDEDALKLIGKLGFFESQAAEEIKNAPKDKLEIAAKVAPAFYSQVETRFFATNEMMVNDKNAKLFLDLGCGYTPRGIKLANSGIKYIGIDLPAVINTISPIIKEFIGENANINYKSGDLTNYSSIIEALGDNKGELFITTEGIMNYLNSFELKEVISNIKRLLKAYGGKWVTCDNTLLASQKYIIAAALGIPPEKSEMLAQMGNNMATSMAKIKKFDNVFVDKDLEKCKKFLDDNGFDLNIEKGSKHLPKMIRAIAAFPENTAANMRKVLEDMDFWIITLKNDAKDIAPYEGKKFNIYLKREEGIIIIKLEGRLDTISSKIMIEAFNDEVKKGNFTEIKIDLGNVEFISSGGIRALTIIDNNLGNEKHIEITNIKDNLKEMILSKEYEDIVKFKFK